MADETGNSTHLPPLYQNVVPMRADTHGKLKFSKTGDFKFAARHNALPLAAVEFVSCARSYPIVFADKPPYAPMCFLGLNKGENCFLREDSAWAKSVYIPAYVRRYPFLLLNQNGKKDGQKEDWLLGIEKDCPRLNKREGDELFSNGKPSSFLEQMVEFCTDYNRHWNISLAFSAALKDAGLLTQEAIDLTSQDESVLNLTGLLGIDEQKLNELPAEKLVSWRDKGWLPPIYAQIASRHNWSLLAERSANTA